MAAKIEKEKKGVAPGAPKPKAANPAQKAAAAVPTKTADGKEIRGIVRMAGKDLKGHWSIMRSIQAIKGMGRNISQVISKAIVKEMGLKTSSVVGELDEGQIDTLEQMLAHPDKHGVPYFMLNRRREVISGESHHLIGTDLTYAVKTDIDHEKDTFTWRGYRHAYGQKVRGQHTRNTGRTGMTVGVIRKAVAGKAGAAAATQAAGAQAASAAPAAAAPSAAAAAKEKKPAEAAKK